MFESSEVAQALGVAGEVAPRRFSGVSTDTRTLQAGQLWFALIGEKFDAHDFVVDAVRAGATGVVVRRASAEIVARRLKAHNLDACVFVVDDTLTALGSLAHYHRRKINPQVIALTGSNGKTSTKQMIAAIAEAAAAHPGESLATQGNLNNRVGVPLTLFGLTPGVKRAVIEMGMNQRGEIAELTRIADPDIGLITNVGTAHIENLGSIENIALEKGDLFAAMRAGTTAVVNLDDAYIARLRRAAAQTVTFGTGEGAQVRLTGCEPAGAEATRVSLSIEGRPVTFRLAFAGRHNALNAAAAAACGLAGGIDISAIAAGLERAAGAGRRLQVEIIGGRTVLNDVYNANPQSVMAGIDTLVAAPAKFRRVAVLGDMFELGSFAPALHAEVGRYLAKAGVDGLVTFGNLARHIAAGAREAGLAASDIVEAATVQEAAEAVCEVTNRGDAVLVKGSRGMSMERIVDALKVLLGSKP